MNEPVRSPSATLRPTTLRLAAIAFVICVGVVLTGTSLWGPAAGAGPDAPEKTIPTLPPSTDDGQTTAPESSVPESSGPPTTAASIETGISLRAGASMAELLGAANQTLGSSSDIAAGLARFAAIPDGIPTPVGAGIESFSVQYYTDPGFFEATSRFGTTASVDDVIAFYETTLTAAGFVLEIEDSQVERRRLEFANPASDYDDASVGVSVDESDGVNVELTITDHANPELLEAFSGWPAGMPTVNDGRPVRAWVSASSGPETSLTVSTAFAYDGVTPEELTTTIRDALADGAGGFTLADSDDGSTDIALVHPLIESPSASIDVDIDDVTILEMTGSVTVG